MAAQQPLPGTGQAGHPAGLAVDVVRVVDDVAAEAVAEGDGLAERDDALGLPDVEGADLVGDAVGPRPRHQQVARDLDRAPERLADPPPHRRRPDPVRPTSVSGRPGAGRKASGWGWRTRTTRCPSSVSVAGAPGRPAGDDRDVVAGLGQGHRGLPGPCVGHVGVVDEDRDAGGRPRRTVAHRRAVRDPTRRQRRSVALYHPSVPSMEAVDVIEMPIESTATRPLTVAVVGATGLVGRTMIDDPRRARAPRR